MASIEVSLTTTPRRKSGKKSANGSLTGTTKPSPHIAKSTLTNTSSTLVDSCKELEMLRHALRDKENTIQNLQGQGVTSTKPLDGTERRAADVRLQQLKVEEDMRRGNIARVSDALGKMDGDENNIDIRIRQAELEYELGREELALLGVREEKRALQVRLDAKPSPTLYSCMQPPGKFLLVTTFVECDAKSPRFGAGNSDDQLGLKVLWATEESGLKKGDRILEVNGKLTLSTSREELSRLLSVCPSRAEIVVCRAYIPPPQAADELLRRENLRLTHRISYLEDQVADLLTFKEKTLTPQVEVFQKGSQVTVISSPESSRTSRTIHNDLPSDSDQSAWRSVNNELGSHIQQTLQDREKSNNEKLRVLTRMYDKESPPNRTKGDTGDRISTVYIHPTKSSSHLQVLSDQERSGRKIKDVQRSVDYSSETTCPRYRSHRDRSVKSLDLDADTSGQDTLTRNTKPPPPKKPLRLSIQRATSLQSMQLPCSTSMGATRRGKHKGIAPPPPPTDPSDTDTSYPAFRWPSHFHRNRSKERHSRNGEKWC